MTRRLWLAAFVLTGACADPLTRPGEARTLPQGNWGGDQIALHVSSDGRGQLTLSCAAADFAGPVKLDIGGHFLTNGTFRRGTGMEMREPSPLVPVNVSGRLDRNGVLWLDVAARDFYPVRSARLKWGMRSILTRCL